MRLYDAHNHLQDERFGGWQPELIDACAQEGVVKMVVNGACEGDWSQVAELAVKHPMVLPSFGYHPWYVHERTGDWQANLVRFLDETPGSVIGEIGLDRWKEGLNLPELEEVFIWQLRLAAKRQLPVSIHCLQAWGRMYDVLDAEPLPACGFLLHSYGGPKEMIGPLAKLGAYFSFPGYYAHERKSRQRETFLHVPPDRLLIETDAPDQALPDSLNRHRLTNGQSSEPINHPANLGAVYQFVADHLGEPLEALSIRIEENFQRLFGNSTPGS